ADLAGLDDALLDRRELAGGILAASGPSIAARGAGLGHLAAVAAGQVRRCGSAGFDRGTGRRTTSGQDQREDDEGGAEDDAAADGAMGSHGLLPPGARCEAPDAAPAR